MFKKTAVMAGLNIILGLFLSACEPAPILKKTIVNGQEMCDYYQVKREDGDWWKSYAQLVKENKLVLMASLPCSYRGNRHSDESDKSVPLFMRPEGAGITISPHP